MKIEGDVIITKNCQFVLMNPFPPEPSPFNDPIRKESARIRRIIRTGGAPIDLTSGTVRASLKHPTRPFTPAPFSRGDPLLPAGNLPELLPSIEGLRLSRHRLLVPAKQHVLPRRLEPLLDKSESVISESASEVSTHRSVPSGLHPQLHHSPSQAQPNRADTKNSNNNEMAGAIKTLRALVSTFPDKIKSSARGDTIDSLLAQTQTTFHDARNLLISLSWLRHSNSTSPLNLVVSKTAEKETRDHIVEGLMKWMQVAEAAAATFPIELEVEIAIGVCSLILRITRDDRVLQNAFKLCFKLSKTDRNDAAFVRYRVYEAIVLYLGHLAADSARLSMSHKCEMAIYAVATLKNLANCEDAVACSDGAVTVLGRIMAVALNGDSPITSTTPSTRSSQIIQLFIQITLTIRSLLSSAPESTQAQLVLPIYKSGDRCTLELLFSMMGDNEVFMDSDELILNVARILSKSSLNSTCLSKMHGQQAIDHFMTVILKFQAEKQTPQPHLLRLLFVLGNLSTPTYDLAPAEEDPTLADLQALARHTCDLVALFAVYTRKVLRKWRRDGGEHGLEVSDEEADAESRVEAGRKVQERKGLDDRNDAGDEEVLVKIVRLLSNMAIHPESGREMSEMIELEMMLELMEFVPMAENEELILNLAGALANFTFYLTDENCLFHRKIEVLELMLPLLLHENSEFVEQATRVYSNISRDTSSPEVQSWMSQHRGGIELLCILLDHPSRGVLFNVCGTLVNVFVGSARGGGAGKRLANRCGKAFVGCDGVSKLTDVVYQSMSEGELEVCILACKALINLIQLQDESVEIDKEFLDEAQDERLGVVMLQLLDIVRPKMKVPPPLVRMKSSENLFSTTPLGDEEIAVSDTGEEMEEMEENNFKINTQIKRNPGPEVWKKECVQVATRLLEVLGYGADDREVAEVGV